MTADKPMKENIVAEAAAEVRQEREFTEVKDFSDEIIVDEDLGIIRVSGVNRKMTPCPECNKYPMTRPDKYQRIVTKILMSKGSVIIEGMSARGVGVAFAVAKELREHLNSVKVKTTWSYVGKGPHLVKVTSDDRIFYQFGTKIEVKLKKKTS